MKKRLHLCAREVVASLCVQANDTNNIRKYRSHSILGDDILFCIKIYVIEYRMMGDDTCRFCAERFKYMFKHKQIK